MKGYVCISTDVLCIKCLCEGNSSSALFPTPYVPVQSSYEKVNIKAIGNTTGGEKRYHL